MATWVGCEAETGLPLSSVPSCLSLTLQTMRGSSWLWDHLGVDRGGDHSQQVQKLSCLPSKEPPQPKVGRFLREAESQAGHRPKAPLPGEQEKSTVGWGQRGRWEEGREQAAVGSAWSHCLNRTPQPSRSQPKASAGHECHERLH